MFCKNCGTQLEDNSAFCYSCGAKIEVEAKAVATAPVAEPADSIENFSFENEVVTPVAETKPVATRKEQRIVRKTSFVGIAFALISLVMYFLPWICVPEGMAFEKGWYFLFNVHTLLDVVEFADGVGIYFWIALIAALVLAAVSAVLLILYIITEFTKKKHSAMMVLSSIISILLVIVSLVTVVCMNSIQVGSLDAFMGDLGNLFKSYAIVSIPVVVLLVSSIVGMFFASRKAKVFVDVEIPMEFGAEESVDTFAKLTDEAQYEPMFETPVVQMPYAEVPVAPVAEAFAPQVEVPVAPVAEAFAPQVEAPVAPVVEAPVYEAPQVEVPVAPVAEAFAPQAEVPVAEAFTPVVEAPVYEAPKVEIPVTPVVETPVYEAPKVDVPVAPVTPAAVPPVSAPEGGSRLVSTMRTRKTPEGVPSTPTMPSSTSARFSKGGDL